MFLLIAMLIEIILTYIIRICFKIQNVEGMILVLITLIIFLIWVVTNKKITKTQRALLILAYIVRIIVIFIRQMTDIAIPYTGGDAFGFHLRGETIANNMSLLKEGIYGGFYSKILGILYYFIGSNRMFAENINVLLAIGAFYNVFIIVNQIGDIKSTLKNTLLEMFLVFLPHGILLSASMLREMIIVFFAILSLKYCIYYLKLNNKKYIFLCFSSIIIAAVFHAGIIFLIVGYVLVMSFYNFKEKKINMSIKSISICIIISFILISVYVTYGDIIASKIWNVNIENTLERDSDAGSAYLGGKEINGIMDIIIYTIPKTIYFMFSPMPWNWRGFADITSFIIDSMIYLYLFYNIIKYSKHLSTKKKQVINLLFLGLILTIIVYALGTTTAGTAIRHRYKIFPYLVTITMICVNSKEKE